MKLFEQLKSNASRMAVYAILVATALCGIAAPVYALNGEKGDVEPAYMASTVKDRYKAFSGDTFYVAEYDTTYRQLRYNKGYDYLVSVEYVTERPLLVSPRTISGVRIRPSCSRVSPFWSRLHIFWGIPCAFARSTSKRPFLGMEILYP